MLTSKLIGAAVFTAIAVALITPGGVAAADIGQANTAKAGLTAPAPQEVSCVRARDMWAIDGFSKKSSMFRKYGGYCGWQ